jgi:hypothetical protein
MPPSSFDASALSALFPTPLLDMRMLNQLVCNSTAEISERLRALEVQFLRFMLSQPYIPVTDARRAGPKTRQRTRIVAAG